jgi:tetratricopeptide (TPR) repeat protein
LRQFAAERLQQHPGEAEAIHGRHGSYYLAFLQQQERHLKGPNLEEALAAIRADIGNVRLAWRWAIEHGRWGQLKAAMESLWVFYEIQGWSLEGDDAYAQAVARLRSLSEQVVTAEAAAPRGNGGLILGTALAYQGAFKALLGQYEQAKALGQESLTLLREAGQAARRETALSLAELGNTVSYLDELVAGIGFLQESCDIFDDVEDRWGRGWALRLLGHHTQHIGRYAEGERHLQESMEIFGALDEQRLIVMTTATLGRVAWARGQNALAETLHQDCLRRQTALGDRLGLATTLKDLGHVARLQGEHAQATEYSQESIAISKEIGLIPFVAVGLCGLGALAELQGDYAEAARLIEESLVWYPTRSTGVLRGWVALGTGDLQAAERCFYGSLRSAVKAQWVRQVLHALTGLAHLSARTGKPEDALEILALVLGHPATHQEFKSRATGLQAELTAELPPEVAEAAKERGRARELDATVAELLSEPGQQGARARRSLSSFGSVL